MVTWAAFIAKMIELLVVKLVNKSIDYRLNDKKRAARTFFKLNQSLGELSKLTKRINNEIDDATRDGYRMEGAWLYEIDTEISELSNYFFRIVRELHEILEIYDPALAKSLNNLVCSKFSIMIYAIQGFSICEDEHKPNQINYSFPSEKLLSIDFFEHYDWISNNGVIDYENLEWPQSVLIGYAEDELKETDFLPGKESEVYKEKLTKLQSILSVHESALSASNKLLSVFIEKNFSLTDVLYSDRL